MKHLQNSAKTISVFDDETTFGTLTANEAEQYPTAPVMIIADNDITHPLRGFLMSAVNLIAPKDDDVLGDETDAYDDHLIPLTDDEDGDELEIGDGHFAAAVSFIDGIAQSLNSETGEAKSPLLLAAFKSRFLG